MSPMFPSAYAPNTYCRFEFRGTGKERIQLIFKDFTLPSLGDGDDCEQADTLHVSRCRRYDVSYLVVHIHPHPLSQILMPSKGRFEPVEVLCGLTMPKPIMSNGPSMLIEFRGRNSGRGNRGIRAEYKFLESKQPLRPCPHMSIRAFIMAQHRPALQITGCLCVCVDGCVLIT